MKKIKILNPDNNKTYDFNVIKGSCGPDVVDLTSFYEKTGMFVYDPGFTSTASCSSEITYIDGEKGILLHRGYEIEELAENSDYPEVCYLLLNGDLPNKKEKNKVKGVSIYESSRIKSKNVERINRSKN